MLPVPRKAKLPFSTDNARGVLVAANLGRVYSTWLRAQAIAFLRLAAAPEQLGGLPGMSIDFGRHAVTLARPGSAQWQIDGHTLCGLQGGLLQHLCGHSAGCHCSTKGARSNSTGPRQNPGTTSRAADIVGHAILGGPGTARLACSQLVHSERCATREKSLHHSRSAIGRPPSRHGVQHGHGHHHF